MTQFIDCRSLTTGKTNLKNKCSQTSTKKRTRSSFPFTTLRSHLSMFRWIAGLTTLSFASHTKANKEMTAIMTKHSTSYNFRVRDEEGKSHEEMLVATVGKVDPKRHLVSASIHYQPFIYIYCHRKMELTS